MRCEAATVVPTGCGLKSQRAIVYASGEEDANVASRVCLLLIFGLTLSNAACQAAGSFQPRSSWHFWLPLRDYGSGYLEATGRARVLVSRGVSYRYGCVAGGHS